MKKKVGRPRADTTEVRAKIEEAAAIDASVEEIAFYANISRETFYEIMKRDSEFSDRIKALREKPVMLARKTAIAKLTESYQNAMDYLKRKRKLEFGDGIDVTSGGEKIFPIYGGTSINTLPKNNGERQNPDTSQED